MRYGMPLRLFNTQAGGAKVEEHRYCKGSESVLKGVRRACTFCCESVVLGDLHKGQQ